MSFQSSAKFVVLIILDGWGIAPESKGNAIKLAKTPNLDRYWASYPHTQLNASGTAVGLPRGEDGNTETGHLNLGAGRIVYQDLERVNMAIADGSFFENQVLIGTMQKVKDAGSNLHLMGLIGAGGVHSNMEHLYALIKMAKDLSIKNLYIHPFTDGRDSPPTSANIYIGKLQEKLDSAGIGEIASVMGRYWAMDRDKRWERTKKAYDALTKGVGKKVKTAKEAVEKSYEEDKTDEFIEPSLVTDKNNKPLALIEDGNGVIFFNFRIDRPRQLTAAFVMENFSEAPEIIDNDPHEEHLGEELKKPSPSQIFDRGERINDLSFCTMTEYSRSLVLEGALPAFPPEIVQMPLGRVLSLKSLRQLRITESEKERFVTYYFNGLREDPFEMEEIIIIPSPNISTYDKQPQMSSEKLTKTLIDRLSTMEYKLVVINFPNADMVGHTGNVEATVKAVETLDKDIGRIVNLTLPRKGAVIITADHGNAEEMLNAETGEVDTEHSNYPVPFIAISNIFLGKSQTVQSGILADVAPTILSLLGMNAPGTMTGRNLLSGIS